MQLNTTLWVNNKTKNIYRIWNIAHDNQANEFVIYQSQQIPKTNQAHFLVRHSEDLSIGECKLLPTSEGFEWFVKFDDHQQNDLKLASQQIPWCRPSELWFNKFTPLNHDISE
jgi:hypothetical protein